MKRNSPLLGIILIGVGLFFLLKQFNITFPFSHIIFTWQSILFFIGIIFSYQGFSNRDDSRMFTGIILLGLGVYFHGLHHFNYWSSHWGYFTLIVSIAFFMKHFVNKREGVVPGIILLIISLFGLYTANLTEWFHDIFSKFETFWPFVFIAIGVYILFFRKK